MRTVDGEKWVAHNQLRLGIRKIGDGFGSISSISIDICEYFKELMKDFGMKGCLMESSLNMMNPVSN